eukprot:jgi/Undpi1/11488/HiC_scaffold_30.g13785.m1
MTPRYPSTALTTSIRSAQTPRWVGVHALLTTSRARRPPRDPSAPCRSSRCTRATGATKHSKTSSYLDLSGPDSTIFTHRTDSAPNCSYQKSSGLKVDAGALLTKRARRLPRGPNAPGRSSRCTRTTGARRQPKTSNSSTRLHCCPGRSYQEQSDLMVDATSRARTSAMRSERSWWKQSAQWMEIESRPSDESSSSTSSDVFLHRRHGCTYAEFARASADYF